MSDLLTEMARDDRRQHIVHLAIAVCGSIHAALLPSYIQVIRKMRIADEIQVAMTVTADAVIPARTLRQYTGFEVLVSPWPVVAGDPPAHIKLARWADFLLVLPATANIIGKAANGIADDLISTLIVSYHGPIAFAPAMNATMWASPAVQRNIRTLQADGRWIIMPGKCAPVAAAGSPDDGVSPSIRRVVEYLADRDVAERGAGLSS